jgi:hypothetical protein
MLLFRLLNKPLRALKGVKTKKQSSVEQKRVVLDKRTDLGFLQTLSLFSLKGSSFKNVKPVPKVLGDPSIQLLPWFLIQSCLWSYQANTKVKKDKNPRSLRRAHSRFAIESNTIKYLTCTA